MGAARCKITILDLARLTIEFTFADKHVSVGEFPVEVQLHPRCRDDHTQVKPLSNGHIGLVDVFEDIEGLPWFGVLIHNDASVGRW